MKQENKNMTDQKTFRIHLKGIFKQEFFYPKTKQKGWLSSSLEARLHWQSLHQNRLRQQQCLLACYLER